MGQLDFLVLTTHVIIIHVLIFSNKIYDIVIMKQCKQIAVCFACVLIFSPISLSGID